MSGRRPAPLGRFEMLHRGYHRLWPVLRRAAALYRNTAVRRTLVVAVVGSLGKSTTARCLAAALGCDLDKLSQRNAGSFVARAVLGIRPGQRHAVVEVGVNGPGQMGHYARLLRPDVAVVTSIGSEHNRSFATLEDTRTEKADMVRELRSGGVAVLNGDDPNALWMAAETAAVVRTFGMDPGNHVRATEVELDWPGGTRFLLHAAGTTRRVRVRLVGRVMVYPVLAAVAVALEAGIPLERALPALEALEPTAGRLQPVILPSGAVLLRDDYKSALESMVAALDVLSQVPARRRYVVLGEVNEPQGPLGPVYRDLGERIGRSATQAYLFCAGRRFRDYGSGAARAGLPRAAVVRVEGGILEFIEQLRGELGEGDVVLIKGRTQQGLSRIALALEGRAVRCGVGACPVTATICPHCPNLERGAPV